MYSYLNGNTYTMNIYRYIIQLVMFSPEKQPKSLILNIFMVPINYRCFELQEKL